MFDLADPSNFGYYLSFSQDNQYKLEYSFNNITREGTLVFQQPALHLLLSLLYWVTLQIFLTTLTHQELELILLLVISRLLMSSRHLMMAHLQFLKLLQILSLDSHSLESFLSKHLLRLALMSLTMHTHIIQRHLPKQLVLSTASNWYHTGGFYKRLPIISDIASYRQIEKINITDGGTEYALASTMM